MRKRQGSKFQTRTTLENAVRVLEIACAIVTFAFFVPDARAQARQCQLTTSAPKQMAGPITSENLIRLRDFGGLGLGNRPEPFELSPNGTAIALQLRQADPITDSYCTSLVIISLKTTARPTVLDDGGDIIAATSTRYGITDLPLGIPKPAIIRWSPDGKLLAYTKFFADRSEIWVHDLTLHRSTRRLVSGVDIEGLAWSDDGSRLVYERRSGLIAARKTIAAEGANGFRYDGRFWPLSSDVPMPPANMPLIADAFDPISGAQVPLRPYDKKALHPDADWPPLSTVYARYGEQMAWSAPPDDGLFSRSVLHVQAGKNSVPCSYEMCSGVTNLWWLSHGRKLVFQRRTGVGDSQSQFFSWAPGRGRPRLLLTTTDALFGCHRLADEILCAQETSLSPRMLVAISTRNGTRRVVFNPNPDYPIAQAGIVRRLEWTNDAGVATFGDLVLPRGFNGKHRLPLVIVQYESRGFLRGGTGDEFPIQALAARGFAVLSFNRTPWRPKVDHPYDEGEYLRLSMEDFADRRNIISSLTAIIGQLDRDGVIDPARVAITGQSDGAVTATFALANAKLFSTAILSTCCESEAMLQQSGEGYEGFYVGMGYPASHASGREFWGIASLAEADNAKPIPILIQAASSEFRMGISTYRELKRREWPIDMYVYPDEGHVKLHPAHRSAIYRRNVQWLDFWFDGRRSANPVDTSQYERWDAFRGSMPAQGTGAF